MYAIRDWLYVGKYTETRSRALLRIEGITAMLQLAEEAIQPDMASLYVPMVDGLPAPFEVFDTGLAFIRAQKAAGQRILVACGAGISRSVTLTMAALMEHEHLELFDAYRAVLEHHPDAFPHFELVISLAAYHGQTLDTQTVMHELWEIQAQVADLNAR